MNSCILLSLFLSFLAAYGRVTGTWFFGPRGSVAVLVRELPPILTVFVTIF